VRVRDDAAVPATLATLGVLAYAWWTTGLTPFSTLASVAVVGAGGAAMLAGRLLLPARGPAPAVPRRAALVWVLLAVGVAGWQLAAWLSTPRDEHPTLSSLANEALDPRPVRALALAAWLVAAAWLGRR
jgi:hypothetical protein